MTSRNDFYGLIAEKNNYTVTMQAFGKNKENSFILFTWEQPNIFLKNNYEIPSWTYPVGNPASNWIGKVATGSLLMTAFLGIFLGKTQY